MEEGIEASSSADIKETYVVVIGESASRHHWGLYGYPRPTTPFMAKRLAEDELFFANNVNSTAIATSESLLAALTLMDQSTSWEDDNYSIVDLFNGAGFSTYWFSNNAVLGAYDTILQVLSRNADYRKFSSPKDADLKSMQRGTLLEDAETFKYRNDLLYDEILLPWLNDALKDGETKQAIFLHLKGSHLTYQYRYPVSFDHFSTSAGMRTPNRVSFPGKVDIINCYDNSIRYTDFIIEEIIEKVEATGGRAWVLYFSDHGEDVGDYNDTYGRDLEKINKYMVDVPFIVWFSEEYKNERNIGFFQNYRDRPYRLDDTIHAIIDIAGLKTCFFDSSRSIFSDSYRMRARASGGKLYLDIPPLDLVNPQTVDQERKLMRRFLQGKEDL
ncbi:MAG: phosphoethanolamine transferase [Synergistaceae bacterium]|nr:phosphoethanolamine transferase [Synergistaceae bacterium]